MQLVEAVRNNMAGYKDALANSNKIAAFQSGSPKEKKAMFAQTLGLPEDDKDLLKDKNIAAVNEAAQGAAKINAEGRDLSSQSYESLRAEVNPKGLEKEKPQDLGKQKLIFQSIMGIIPTVLGYAIGDEQGGAIGGNIGVQGVKDVESYYANAEAKQAAAAKEAKEDSYKERDFDFKTKDAQQKAESNRIQQERLAQQAKETKDYRNQMLNLSERKVGITEKNQETKLAPKSLEKRLSSLSGEETKRLDNIVMGTKALDNMQKALLEGTNTFSLVGDNEFTMAREQWNEAIGRMQSGGAIGVEEAENFKKLVPGVRDSRPIQLAKLKQMKEEMAARLKTMGFTPEEMSISGQIQTAPLQQQETKNLNGVNYIKVNGGWQKVK